MKALKYIAAPMVVILGFTLNSQAYFEYCRGYAESLVTAAKYFSSMVPLDLLSFIGTETNLVKRGQKSNDPSFQIINQTIDALNTKGIKNPSTSQVRMELNEQTLLLLRDYQPNDPHDRRLDFLTEDIVTKVLWSIENHSIVSSQGMLKYDQKGTNIGYCFGRALYVELMLLRLGVDQDSIKKIWAVGPMKSGSITWQFHVGTMVRLKDGRWVVIDNVVNQIMDAGAWYKYFLRENHPKDPDLRVYVTDSNKFTPSLGKYSRQQLGLDLLPSKDWYQGYFTDLLKWFKETDDAELAKFLVIPKLPDRPLSGEALSNLVAAQRAEHQAKLAKEEDERRQKLQNAYGIDFTTVGVDDGF